MDRQDRTAPGMPVWVGGAAQLRSHESSELGGCALADFKDAELAPELPQPEASF